MKKWKIVDQVPDAYIGYRAIIDDEGFTVCDPSPMGEENARLIAAAPDLLDALRWISRCVSMSGPAGTNAYIISEEIMTKARAAIARAEGEAV